MPNASESQSFHKQHWPPRSAIAALALASFGSAACTSVHYMPAQQLARLDGFREDQRSFMAKLDPRSPPPPAYHLIDEDGKGHTFDASSRLVLDIRAGREEDTIEERYRAITVSPDLFIGLPQGSSREVRVPMAQIDRAGLRKFSLGKTVGLLAGIAGAALLTLVIVSASLSDGSSNGGGHTDFD